jgi:alpha-D-xyloside xylohydrolase
MKLSDGHWRVPEHLNVVPLSYVHDVRIEGDQVVADVSAIEFRSRLDQIHATVFTLRLFAPAEGIAAREGKSS